MIEFDLKLLSFFFLFLVPSVNSEILGPKDKLLGELTVKETLKKLLVFQLDSQLETHVRQIPGN
jgi:hypothetical protein